MLTTIELADLLISSGLCSKMDNADDLYDAFILAKYKLHDNNKTKVAAATGLGIRTVQRSLQRIPGFIDPVGSSLRKEKEQ